MEEKIYFRSSGVKLAGVHFTPTEDKDFIIILCHGFSTHKNNKTNSRLSEFLFEHGIASFRFDFYGHRESEGHFEDITLTKAVENLKDAYKFVKSLGYKNIALFGSSFGGIVSMLASTVLDIRFLALKSPVSDYVKTIKNIEGEKGLKEWKKTGKKTYKNHYGKTMDLSYSFVEDMNKEENKIEPEKIDVPTLIVHGDSDQIVDINQSKDTNRNIKDSKLHIIHGADHYFSQPKHWEEMIKAVEEFIMTESKSQNLLNW